MSQQPPKKLPPRDVTQGPRVRRTPVHVDPASPNRVPEPGAAPAQSSPDLRTSRQASPSHRVTGQARQRQGRPPEGAPRQAQYRPVVPRRDPFPLLIGGIFGAILLGVVLIVLLLGRSDTPSGGNGGNVAGEQTSGAVRNPTQQASVPTIQLQASNLPGTPVPEEGKSHVAEGEVITYRNYPPTSGTHYDSTAEYGFSDMEIPEGKLVHNLEHGAIVLYYKPDLPADVLDSLRQAYSSLPPGKYSKVKLIITPYPKLQTPMAVAAWTRVEPLMEFNFERIHAFYLALVDKGPEDVP